MVAEASQQTTNLKISNQMENSLGCSGDASSGIYKWPRMERVADHRVRIAADGPSYFGRVDYGFVPSLRIRTKCGHDVRFIRGSEAIVTSEIMKSSDAIRILRIMENFRSHDIRRQRRILNQKRHTKGRTFDRNEIQSMTSEVRTISEQHRNHLLQVETKRPCIRWFGT